ncbi:MAG: phosphoribosylaminoimidazolesuccinocarboxamide synthase [Anaerolineae bacterium]|nr:phosphoribosylaminoimidazolesuccinocarboxamide synthase [Anaerolineae bacterium]
MIPTRETILDVQPHALRAMDLPELGPVQRGKVRDSYVVGDRRVLITTDRLSAFDRVLGVVPYKGQVLNQLSRFWFEALEDVVPSHMLDTPDPNVMLARESKPFPVEVVVRGYITGVTTTSLWYSYERGQREMYGIRLPEGLRKNQALPEPVITPTTRATGPGGHDERITPAEIVERGLVSEDDWRAIVESALRLFARGQEICQQAGIILVDTKYEFGRVGGQIVVIDEVHTPDSSRFWKAESYQERVDQELEPENLDKEFVRLWYSEQGYRGEGDPPPMGDDLVVAAAQRYVQVYEAITGAAFEPARYPAEDRIRDSLRRAGILSA